MRLADLSQKTNHRSNSRNRGRRSWSPVSRSGRKLPMLEKFSSKSNFVSFKYCFEKIAIEEGWYTTKAINATKSKLKDRLFDYLKDDALEFALNVGKKTSYKNIMEKLATVYGHTAQKSLAMTQLATMKQTDDLTVGEFYSAILRKAQEAYVGEDIENTATIQTTLMTTFLHGIKDSKAAFHVINNKSPENLYDAYKAVVKYQENRDALVTTAVHSKRIRKSKTVNPVETDDSDLEYESDDTFEVKYNKVFKNKTDQTRFMKRVAFLAKEAEKVMPSKQKEGRAERDQCHYCHKTGHFISNCPVKSDDEDRRILKILELHRKQTNQEAEKSKLQLPDNSLPKKSTLVNKTDQTSTIKVKKVDEQTDDDIEIFESGESDFE